MGDFSGRAQESATFVTHRAAIGDLDRVFAALRPTLPLRSGDGSTQQVTISSLEDLHPDELATHVSDLRRLLELERELEDPATEASALAELDALAGPAARSETQRAADEPPGAAAESDDELLGRVLGHRRADRTSDRARQTVERLIDGALGSSRTPGASREAAGGRERIAALLDERCRRLLHDPRFRGVERSWRSVHWLLSRLEDDEAEVHLVDVSKQALAGHLGGFADALESSPLHALLTGEAGEGWDLIVGDYSFGPTADDLVLLATLGALAARAGAPFLGHAELGLAGCPGPDAVDSPWDWSIGNEDLAGLWRELRRHPAAKWVGLATPRFLLRYPYGPKNDPTERFELEELSVKPAREELLWGNPAFACALLIGRAHADAERSGFASGEVADLPTPIYRDGGGEAVQPPLEFLLTERAAATAAEHGLTVFTGGRNTNRIVTTGIASLAFP